MPLVRSAVPPRYEAALERVMGLADFERSVHSPGYSSFHLERMRLAMERLGNPHLGVPSVHIAGTKGKGSTAAMVTSILAAQGYIVGLFTSPHLHSAVERIRVGLEPVARDDFATLVEQVWPAAEWVRQEGGHGPLSTFEMLTVMAFYHFDRIRADFQVIEVGLGGRLDSTNVVCPEVCAITPISLDHVMTLGNTIPLIAREKAGIVKPGIPVVVAPQSEEAMAVVRDVAGDRQAPIVDVRAGLSYRKRHADLAGQSFEITGGRDSYDLWTSLLGDHQLENSATAIAVIETLVDRGFTISKESIEKGLKEVRWPARLEVFRCDGRLVVVDGAHNPHSMGRLVQAVRSYFQFRRLVVIFGALGGHSAEGMIGELASLRPMVLAVRSRQPRSADAGAIADIVSQHGLPVFFQSEDTGEATRKALEMAEHGDLVLATGSLSVAAEVREEIMGIAPELYPYIKRPSRPGAATIV